MDMPLEARPGEAVPSKEGFALPLQARNRAKQPLRGVFYVSVKNERIQYQRLQDLAGEEVRQESIVIDAPSLPNLWRPLEEGVPVVKKAVEAALVEAGLYPKEAQAMVNSWEKSYFRTEGPRLLYVLPRPLVDAVIPITIEPAPEQLVRVMVGRTELLTPEMERKIEQWIGQLGSTDFQVRESATQALARLGRLGEPALRRVAALTKDAEVRARAQRLIHAAMAKE